MGHQYVPSKLEPQPKRRFAHLWGPGGALSGRPGLQSYEG